MVDLGRLRGIILAVAYVLLCLACVEAAFGATKPWWPAFMQQDMGFWPDDAYSVAGGQLSAIQKERRTREEPIGVFVGSSSLYRGVDPARLEMVVQPRLRWRRLTLFGATVCELEPIVYQVFADRVQPVVLVIALDLRMLARNPAFRHVDFDVRIDASAARVFHDVKSLRLKAAVEDVEGLLSNGFNDCFPDRTRFYGRLNSPLSRLRMATLRWLGQSAEAMFSPDWQPEAARNDIAHRQATPQELEKVLKRNMAKGGLDPQFYSTGSEASQSLVNLIRLSRSMGTEAIIVVMPENSTFRARTPAIASKTLTDLLEHEFGVDAPPVIMLREALSDDLFLDFYHPTDAGVAALTTKLGEALNKLKVRAGDGSPRAGEGGRGPL
jgi:hypothetical protein